MATTRRTRMPMAAKLAPAVVVAGTALGWLLGSAATPVMKQRVEPGQHPAAAAAAAMPTAMSKQDWPNLAAERLPRSGDYRADLDYNTVVGPSWDSPDIQAEAYLPPIAPLPSALEAADEAEQAADEAAGAMTEPAPDKPETVPGSRKSALAQSGLY